MRKLVAFSTILFILVLIVPSAFAALTISAEATGSTSPSVIVVPPGTTDSIQNIDFTITQSTSLGSAQVWLGDALNEKTDWTFDFRNHPDFPNFSTSLPLVNAVLTLELTYTEYVTDDWVAPEGLIAKSIPEIREDLAACPWPNRCSATVQVDMLDYYSSDEILSVFSDGEFPMHYEDDAIVSYAKLDLTIPTIPDVHGTWEFKIENTDADWDGTKRTVEIKGTAYVCQYGYVNAYTPNLRVFPVDDLGDPLWGFGQERRFAFYKDDFDDSGSPMSENLGREIIMGKVSRNGNQMRGQTMGFDTNLRWGTSWGGRIHLKRISNDTGGFVCP